MTLIMYILRLISGAGPGFQARGGLKQIAPSGGRRENCWGISCEKSRFYGGGAPGGTPWIRPWGIQKLININRRKLVEILVLILTK